MVNKAIGTFSCDPNVLESAQALYPRKISSLIEGFLRDLIGSELNLNDYDSKAKIIEAISSNNVDINKAISEQNLLKHQLKEVQDAEQKDLSNVQAEEKELLMEFKRLEIEKDIRFQATFEQAVKQGIVEKEIPPYKFYFNNYLVEGFEDSVWSRDK
jgi:hypothetical protein